MQNTFSPVPLVRWLFPVIFGIIVRCYSSLGSFSAVWMSIISALFILWLLLIISKNNKIWSFSFYLLLFMIGFTATNIQLTNVENTIGHPERLPFIAVIDEIPVVKQSKTVAVTKVIAVKKDKEWVVWDKKAIVSFIAVRDSLLQPGDVLLIKSGLSLPGPPVFPLQFDYGLYCRNNGITYLAKVRKKDYLKLNVTEKSLKYCLLNLRGFLLKRISFYFGKNDEQSLFASLTLGYTESLTPELKSSYAKAGVMHVLSVSGLHVGIIYLYLSYLFWFLKKNKKTLIVHSVLVFVGLWLYAFISGMSSPVIRSTIMFSMFALAGVVGRKGQSFNILSASALIILMVSPLQLFSVGFQLSYAAMAGIFIFYEPINFVLPGQNKFIKNISALVAVSLAAQLSTLPFTLYYFQSFPLYFLVANLVIVPAASILLYVSSSFMMFASFDCSLTSFFAYILKVLYSFFNHLVRIIADLPWSTAYGFSFSFVDAVILVFVIAFAYLLLHKRESRLVVPLLTIVLFFFIRYNTRKISSNTETMVFFTEVSYNCQVVTVKQGGSLFHFLDNKKYNLDWVTQNFKAFYGVKNEKCFVLSDVDVGKVLKYNELFVMRLGDKNFLVKNDKMLLHIVLNTNGSFLKAECWKKGHNSLVKQDLISCPQRTSNDKPFF
ncbi:MAG TPA: ComEC/Rec2 family competence protein [Bacteroidales bacterium]